jgi:SWI/SNF-related matrix-associated actin-dependent regulator 1 of chromatin subfamily A
MRLVGEAALVVCPAIVRTHWRETLADVMGSGSQLVHVKSYTEIVQLGEEGRRELLATLQPNFLILDESHMLMNMAALRTRLILGKDGYARRIPIVWAASGTPVPRHPGNMYAILATLFPHVLARHSIYRYEEFETRFLIQRAIWVRGIRRYKVVGLQNEAEFREILAETMLQRTLNDIGDTQPKLLWQVLALDGDTAAVKAATATLPLSTYENASHVRKLVGLAKVQPVVEMLGEQLDQTTTEKVVVFAHHLDVLKGIAEGLRKADIPYVYVDGSVTQAKRDLALYEFRENPMVQVFLGQNMACMMGIDLSSASSILAVEPDWVATNNDQMGHRILGPNQQAAHVVTQMIALAGTIDDSIVRQNAREAAMQDRMFGGGV